jgi:hypothetical protein
MLSNGYALRSFVQQGQGKELLGIDERRQSGARQGWHGNGKAQHCIESQRESAESICLTLKRDGIAQRFLAQ